MAKVKKKELGKGIRALLSNMEDSEASESNKEIVQKLSGSIAMIPINEIEVNPFQPRTVFDEEKLEELAQSIKVHGLIQPVTLRRLSENAYQIISGERRFRASQKAGLNEIPAYIRLANDQEMIEMALVENIQRQDLNAIEVAITYQRLMDECALTHESLSERVGKNRSTITNYVRLLKLPPHIQAAIKLEKISMGHARALIGIEDTSLQLEIFNQVLNRQLSVRATEDLVRSYQNPKTSKRANTTLSPELKNIQESLMDKFSTAVKIQRNNKGKGKIVINFDSDKSLNYILDIIDA